MDLFDKTRSFVAENIGTGFHRRRIRKLKKAQLAKLLSKGNPLLMRAQAIETAKPIVKELLDAHVLQSDEALFGDFMKQVAVFVATEANGGSAPRAESVDLEFGRGGRHYALAVKPRAAWGNARQIGKMVDAFRAASAPERPADVTFLIGCMSGEGSSAPAPQCEKICGPDFWRFIADDEAFDGRLVDCIEVDSKSHAKKFNRAYKGALKALTEEFQQNFCDAEGRVQWHALAQFEPGEDDASGEADDDHEAPDRPEAQAASA